MNENRTVELIKTQIGKWNEEMEAFRQNVIIHYIDENDVLREAQFVGVLKQNTVAGIDEFGDYIFFEKECMNTQWSYEKEVMVKVLAKMEYESLADNRQWKMRKTGEVKNIDEMTTAHLKNAVSTVKYELKNKQLNDEVREYYESVLPLLEDEMELREGHCQQEKNEYDEYIENHQWKMRHTGEVKNIAEMSIAHLQNVEKAIIAELKEKKDLTHAKAEYYQKVLSLVKQELMIREILEREARMLRDAISFFTDILL